MEEVIRENCINHQNEEKIRHQRELKELIKREKQQNRKEIILGLIIGLFITTLSVMYIANSNNEAYKKCMNDNNSKHFCERIYE